LRDNSKLMETADVIVVGGGAAGLATAIFAARRRPERKVWILDGARKLGAKILVSGGGRCNVTNRVVTEADFNGGSSRFVRRVLRAFRVEQTVAFFEERASPCTKRKAESSFPTRTEPTPSWTRFSVKRSSAA